MGEPTFIIAEAGVNHNGSFDLALKLIDVAADAGADAVKFQTFKAEQLATATAAKAGYQVTNTGHSGSQLEMLRSLELPDEAHARLAARCRERRIRYMSTAFDAQSLQALAALDPPAIKMPSGDITCAPLLLQAARLGRRLIISTGMCTLSDVEAALGVVAFGLTVQREPAGVSDFELAYASVAGRRALEENVTLLHCVTQYPAAPDAINLRAMDTLATAFGLPVGYSDHTLGTEVAVAAVARGAVVIEKHFTLDRTLPGPDHAASLEPSELAYLVTAIRNVERAIGSPIKRVVEQEAGNRAVARRSLVAACPIRRGELITAGMLASKRPGQGLSPMYLWNVIGRKAGRDYEVDDPIES